MDKLYHVSKVPGLNLLEPRVSTHGKPYVYAAKDLCLALLFGSSKSHGDFDGMYGRKDGVPYFYEAYHGAFKDRFQGEICYIYEVERETFKENQTSFKAELVSEVPVKVLNCTKV
ncbi:MAG: hypothetical protein IJY90_03065 [Clostridia bacterium]|nr:hypothetical protein [Clostridia bacterium]